MAELISSQLERTKEVNCEQLRRLQANHEEDVQRMKQIHREDLQRLMSDLKIDMVTQLTELKNGLEDRLPEMSDDQSNDEMFKYQQRKHRTRTNTSIVGESECREDYGTDKCVDKTLLMLKSTKTALEKENEKLRIQELKVINSRMSLSLGVNELQSTVQHWDSRANIPAPKPLKTKKEPLKRTHSEPSRKTSAKKEISAKKIPQPSNGDIENDTGKVKTTLYTNSMSEEDASSSIAERLKKIQMTQGISNHNITNLSSSNESMDQMIERLDVLKKTDEIPASAGNPSKTYKRNSKKNPRKSQTEILPNSNSFVSLQASASSSEPKMSSSSSISSSDEQTNGLDLAANYSNMNEKTGDHYENNRRTTTTLRKKKYDLDLSSSGSDSPKLRRTKLITNPILSRSEVHRSSFEAWMEDPLLNAGIDILSKSTKVLKSSFKSINSTNSNFRRILSADDCRQAIWLQDSQFGQLNDRSEVRICTKRL